MTDEWVIIDEDRDAASKSEIISMKQTGNKYFRQREYSKAIQFYTDAIHEIHKSEHHQQRMVYQWQCILSNRAKAYNQLKQYHPAIQDLTKCIELRPASHASYKARYTRSEILYLGLHDATDALADCVRILRVWLIPSDSL